MVSLSPDPGLHIINNWTFTFTLLLCPFILSSLAVLKVLTSDGCSDSGFYYDLV